MIFSRTMDWIDDHLNPVVVKEVRQSVNSKGILSTSLLFLAVELILLLTMTMDRHSRLEGQGMDMFTSVISTLALACVLGVAAATAQRFSTECKKDAMDLLHSTVISPYRVISGKIFSAMVMVVYLFSLSVPFMCVAYFMRGISLDVIIFYIYLLIMCMFPLMALATLIGSLNMSVIIRVALLIGILWGGGSVFFGLLAMLRFGGFSSSISYLESGFWVGFFTCAATGIFYVMSVASVSHRSSNRMLPLKSYFALLWLVSLVIMFFWGPKREAVGIWAMFSLLALSVLCAGSSAERLEQSARVLKLGAKKTRWRFFYFILSSGAVNTIAFSFILALSTVGIAFSYYASHRWRDFETIITIFSGIYAYILFYAGLAVFVRNRLGKVFPRINGFVYFMALALIFSLLPLLIMLLVYLDFDGVEKHGAVFFILSPAAMCYSYTRTFGLAVALGGCVITVFMNKKYYRQYCRDFFKPVLGKKED